MIPRRPRRRPAYGVRRLLLANGVAGGTVVHRCASIGRRWYRSGIRLSGLRRGAAR
jgi:hypothetical protein